jgi:hypothetical protein
VETRLDRIEKAIEALLLGISELKESQKKTDFQILQLRESQQQTDEQMRRTDAKLDRIGTQLADQGLVQGEVAGETVPCSLSAHDSIICLSPFIFL